MPAAGGALPAADRRGEPAPLRPARGASPTSRPAVERMLEQTGLARTPRRPGRAPLGRQPAAGQHRDRPARRAGGPAARRAQRRPRPAPARAALGVRARPRRRRDDGDLLDPPHRRRPSATATGCWSSPTASALFDGTPAELHAAVAGGARGAARLRGRLRRLPARAGPLMRWLLLKDLQILRRSPLQAALLVVYPIVLARADRLRALARAPRSRGSPSSTRSRRTQQFNIGGGSVRRRSAPATQLCSRVECVDVSSRAPRREQKVAGRRRARRPDPARGPLTSSRLAHRLDPEQPTGAR